MTWIIMPPKTFDGEILLSSSKISKYGSPTSKFFPLSQYFYELPSAPPSANLHIDEILQGLAPGCAENGAS